MALLDVKGLTVEYVSVGQVNHAVNDISFHVEAGEVIGIVGESGSGKSTAMLGVLGLTRAGARIAGGSVVFDGSDMLKLSDDDARKIRGAKIGLVTQNPRGALNPVMRVGAQIEKVYRSHNEVTEEQAKARALELLQIVGINDPERRLQAFPHELSGGMAQRVLIAMALACSPKLLLADEPTSGLDVTVQAQVLDDLRAAVTSVGSSLVLVTQDLGIVANYCDRVYLMHAGEIVEEAPTEAFFSRPAHPASAALLLAQRRGEGADEFKLRGFPIDGRRLPPGCWLHPRCPFVDEAAGCRTQHPDLYEAGAGHVSRCHRFGHVQSKLAALLAGDTGKKTAVNQPVMAESGGEGDGDN
ncbi:MAG: ABC transporter ATP-binding protein [Thermoleophilia bacterium]